MDPSLKEEIEGIQEDAYSMLGRDPDESSMGARAFQLPQDAANEIADEDILRFVPEHIYDLQFLGVRMRNPVRTRYDREIVLQRLWNLEDLCHGYFENAFAGVRLDIQVATLPFAQVNGVCFFASSTGGRVVMLNEGLLFVAPELTACLFEMRNLRTMVERLAAGDEEWAIPESKRLNETAFQPFIQLLLHTASGAMTIPDLQETRPDMPLGALRIQTKENWKFVRELEKVVARESGNDDWEPTTPPQGALQYFACRGFLTVILGHEFSHFYHDHHVMREAREAIRNLDEWDQAVEELRAYFGEPDIEKTFGNTELFAVVQPTEIEADIDGFMCVAKYAADNGLSGDELNALALGCAGTYWIMEWQERIQIIQRMDFEAAMAVFAMPNTIRNMVLQHEHPCPASRMQAAVEALIDDPKLHDFALAVARAWDDLIAAMEWVWANSAERLAQFLKQPGITLSACQSRAGLFEGKLALGCFDAD